MKKHQISAEHLSIERIGEVVYGGYKIELSDDAQKRIVECREYLDRKIAETTAPIYGVTTGFGSLCNVSIGADDLAQLQINLMMSHACGTGDRVPNDIVKIMLLLKIQSLSYGFSGCQLVTVNRLIDFFNNDVYPVVYMQGSLGASGDLVPLAHLTLPLVGLGEVEVDGKVISGEEMLRKFNWQPIQLASKEGLALLNGTQNMGAFAVWALLQSHRLSDWADKIAAMSLDAYYGLIAPFTDAVHRVRPHKGQIVTAARMRELLAGSEIVEKPKSYVQDPYSFRCIPQVHGTVKDTIAYVDSVIDVEVNSATDNPTVCPDSIPSSQGQEDHVSMGANAAIKLYKVVLNTERVLAIELFNAAQALEFRRPLKSSPAVEAIFESYRKVVPFIVRDEVMYPHIANSIEFLRK